MPRQRTAASTDTDQDWGRRLETVRVQLARHGNLRRAARQTQNWADTQIRALRAGCVPAGRREQLEAAGLTAGSLTSSEDRMLRELDRWVTRHGDARVPQAATSRTVDGRPYLLGRRVADARYDYQRGTLAPVMVEALQRRPGWVWRVMEQRQDAMWETQYAALQAHVRTAGSLDGLAAGVYKWLLRQRADAELPAERRARLTAIPEAMTSRDTRVTAFVDVARAWLSADRDRTMADLKYADIVDADGRAFPLGRRATYYRRRFAGLEGTHPLTPTETALIASLPGWSWTLQERYRRPRQAAGSADT